VINEVDEKLNICSTWLHWQCIPVYVVSGHWHQQIEYLFL